MKLIKLSLALSYISPKTFERLPFRSNILHIKYGWCMMPCRGCAFKQFCGVGVGQPYPSNKLVR